ncbi:collagen binding domain-containing protein [Paenibacillus frigoriresistens]|uniref:collagen binding domain-containing protein n=1 Tax=Paenibacillus alginolyticus TaxID=59839 RepID=UPI001565B8F4|nr:collagen binding domain-containing protein [Paenibacillus frigoriresistens]NRF94714.1 collagen binding domain-containing protein [Paenibacillus frigoriresistens]
MMLKKKTSALLITLLIFMQSIYGIGFLPKASANTISNNILDSVTMAVYDNAGQVVTGNVYEQGASVKLDYTWSLPNGHGYHAGDTFMFTLPQQFLLFNHVPGDLIMGNVPVGTFYANKDSHQVLITFNNFIESHDNVRGTLTFNTQFNKSQITENTTQIITIPIHSGEQVFTLKFKPSVNSTIEKKGVFQGFNAKQIDWTIDVNKTLDSVQEAVVTDPIQAGLSVPVTVAVYHLDIRLDGTVVQEGLVESSKYTVSTASNMLSVRFIGGPIDTAYRIQFTTPIIDGSKPSFVNTATFAGSNKTPVHSTATVTVQTINQLAIVKTVGVANYEDRTVDWKIVINGDSQEMNNVVVTDTFPNKGIHFIPSSLAIKKGDAILSAGEYTLDSSVASDVGFTVAFTNAITKPVTITYKTEFKLEWNQPVGSTVFNNTAQIDWIDPYNHEQTKKVTTNFVIRSEVINNGFKTGSYNALLKELTWRIGVNYNKKIITEAVVEDILESNQKLVEGSLMVYNMIIAPNGNYSTDTVVDPKNYKYQVDANNKLILTFKQPISGPYYIVFNTSLNGQLISGNVKNTAKLFDGNDPVSSDLTASVNIPYGGEYVSKNGLQNGDKIDWTITINRGQSTLTDAALIDTPTVNQILLPDSFHLFGTSVTANGNVTKGTELTKGTDYTVVIRTDNNGKQTFELRFVKQITSAYILEYQSLIVANDHDIVSNKVSLSGNNVTTGTLESVKNILVGVSSGSGTGSGVRGSLTVKKVDSANNALLLNGATFELYRKSGQLKDLIRSLTTNETGTVVFTDLLAGDYVVSEKVAPNGYVLNTIDYPVTLYAAGELSVTVTNVKTSEPEPPVSPPTESPTPTPSPTPSTPPTPTPTPTVTPAPSISPSPSPTPAPSTIPKPTGPDIPIDTDNDVPLGGIPPITKPETLPKTGESSHLYVEIAGITLILLGLILRRRFTK